MDDEEQLSNGLTEREEQLRVLLRQFADVLIQIRKDTNANGQTGLNAIDWTQKQLHAQIESAVGVSSKERKDQP